MATISCPNCSAPVDYEVLIPIGDAQVCPNCRDLYLQQIKEFAPTESGPRAFRAKYLKHEASVRSIGILYWLGSFFLLVSGVSMGVLFLSEENIQEEGILFLIPLVYVALGILLVFMGRGMRKLSRWVRIPVTLLATIGLLGFPVGTLINGYILHLIWSENGKTVFSREYAKAIEETPDMKYRSSLLVKILLGILFVILLSVIVAVLVPVIGLG